MRNQVDNIWVSVHKTGLVPTSFLPTRWTFRTQFWKFKFWSLFFLSLSVIVSQLIQTGPRSALSDIRDKGVSKSNSTEIQMPVVEKCNPLFSTFHMIHKLCNNWVVYSCLLCGSHSVKVFATVGIKLGSHVKCFGCHAVFTWTKHTTHSFIHT